jgi:tRNA(His) 5'-end guanylyltransferase
MTSYSFALSGIGELQRSMQRFETYNDGFALPDTYLIVRLDAHRYGDWTSVPAHEYPCGSRITTALHATAQSLLTSSFRVTLAYAHGDEISLLLDPSESASPIRRSKLISMFASAAAVHFREHSNLTALFDGKLSELPSRERVLEYFLWQRRCCLRNALTTTLRKTLIATGLTPEQCETRMHGVSEDARIEMLKELGAPLTSLPITTTRGAFFTVQRQVRRAREEFAISTITSIPDSDAEYITLVEKLVRPDGRSASTVAVSNGDTPTAHTNYHQRAPRKAQVSVFKASK